MNNRVIREGYRSAQQLTRVHAKSFYFASFAFWGARRRAAFSLYAFCRRLDDLVDASPSHEVRPRLASAREFVSELFRSPTVSAAPLPWTLPELVALQDSLQRFKIPEQPFQDLISGMEMDATEHQYFTNADLDLYCYRVAGTVGLMLTRVLGATEPEAQEPAADLGRAMQRTNILRDLDEDFARGRCYLPQETLQRFGLTQADLRQRRVDERFVAMMQDQILQARELYARAALGIPFLKGFGAKTLVRLMSAIYSGILGSIEARAYNVFGTRAHVSTPAKLGVAARVLLGGRS
ncbi:MAG: phytoene/squalene synthase family protein [Myxococcaceae bacterium]